VRYAKRQVFRARHDDRSDLALHDCDEIGVMRFIRAVASELLAQELGVIWLDLGYERCGLPPPVTAPSDEPMVPIHRSISECPPLQAGGD